MTDTLRLNKHIDLSEIIERPQSHEYVIEKKGPRIPKPKIGLVIPYAFLWQREAATGQTEGIKTRPCIVMTATSLDDKNQKFEVLVAPITHSMPMNQDEWDCVVEIPHAHKKALGLDDLPSFICCDEFNQFEWPSEDLHITAKGDSYVYGVLDRGLFAQVTQKFTNLKIRVVHRETAFEPEENAL